MTSCGLLLSFFLPGPCSHGSDMFNRDDRMLQIYAKYPRKLGKSQGMKVAKSKVKTEEDCLLLEKALDKYKEHLAREGTEKQYIMYFSTFVNQWRDWLDEDTGTVDVQKFDLTGISFD